MAIAQFYHITINVDPLNLTELSRYTYFVCEFARFWLLHYCDQW